jgi:hypothetical protein
MTKSTNTTEAKNINIPEFGWSGNQKKIEIRDEKLIRQIFEYAGLIGTDFTEALRRTLTLALPVIIENERLSRERLAACFRSSSESVPFTPSAPQTIAPAPVPVSAPEPIYQYQEPAKAPKKKVSAADLI